MDLNRIFLKGACPTSIGGQAIMEGIMMRGPKRTAIAIRLPNGKIHMKTQPTPQGSKWGRIPLIRGVINFVASLVYGTKVLMYSADVLEANYPEEYEKDKFDIWVEEKLGKEKAWNILMVLSVVLALVMSVGIFMLLPTVVVGWVAHLTESVLVLNLIEGLARILIFVLYIWLISMMKDIKTVFQYHGAEHKTIHCYEHGLPLTPENARNFPRLHVRCGTAFLIMVMVIAIVVYTVVPIKSLIVAWGVTNPALKLTLVILVRIALMPVIAGVSYEITVKWAGSHPENPLVKLILWPGMQMQYLTTREPDDGQIECAIKAMQLVLEREEAQARLDA